MERGPYLFVSPFLGFLFHMVIGLKLLRAQSSVLPAAHVWFLISLWSCWILFGPAPLEAQQIYICTHLSINLVSPYNLFLFVFISLWWLPYDCFLMMVLTDRVFYFNIWSPRKYFYSPIIYISNSFCIISENSLHRDTLVAPNMMSST